MGYNGIKLNEIKCNGRERTKWIEWDAMEWNGMEWNRMELSGMEWNCMGQNAVELHVVQKKGME